MEMYPKMKRKEENKVIKPDSNVLKVKLQH